VRAHGGVGRPFGAPLMASVLLLAAGALAAVPAAGAVLVELFTSQGCSSCPPADRLLRAMGEDPELARQVVPLAFHVDYWNRLGWRDRFSDAAWTRRQNDYARAAEATHVYTPQVVVAGHADCNGTDVACIRKAVAAAAARPQGRVGVDLAPAADGAVTATVRAQAPAGAAGIAVMVAVYESGLETEVRGGENARKTLHNDYVVRRLQRAFELAGGAERSAAVTLRLDRAWRRDKLGVVVFLQDPKSHRVHAAATAAMP
jgi:hypothetical protein